MYIKKIIDLYLHRGVPESSYAFDFHFYMVQPNTFVSNYDSIFVDCVKHDKIFPLKITDDYNFSNIIESNFPTVVMCLSTDEWEIWYANVCKNF